MRRTLTCLPLSLVAGVMVAISPTPVSAGGPAHETNTLRAVLPFSDLESLDPARPYAIPEWTIFRGLYRTLMSMDAENRLVPDLAAGPPEVSADRLAWTFRIRPGVRYGLGADGEAVPGVTGVEVTSEDLRYGIERASLPSVACPYASYFEEVIDRIETPDSATIRFILVKPASDLGHRLGLPAATAVPQRLAAQFDRFHSSRYGDHAVPTGPYQVLSFRHARLTGTFRVLEPGRIELARNPFWSRSSDPVRRAEADRFVCDTAVDAPDDPSFDRLVADDVFAGRYDFALSAQPSEAKLDEIFADPALSNLMVRSSYLTVDVLFFRTTEPPFDDVHVRRAVQFAQDKRRTADIIGPISREPASSFLPPQMPGHLTTAEYDPFQMLDPEGGLRRARDELKLSKYAKATADGEWPGYGTGPGETPVLVVFHERAQPAFVTLFKQILDDLRIARVVEQHEDAFARYFDPASGVGIGSFGWIPDYAHPAAILEFLARSNQPFNAALLEDAEIDAALDAMAAATPEGVEAAAEAANRLVTENGALGGSTWRMASLAHSPRVKNVRYNFGCAGLDWLNFTIKN